MRALKILVVNKFVPSGDGQWPQYHGEWRDAYELSVALARAGAEVTLLSPAVGKHEIRVRQDIDWFAAVEGVKLYYANFALTRRAGNYTTIRLSLAWLCYYAKERPDLIIFKQARAEPGLLFPSIRKKSVSLACSRNTEPAPARNEQTNLVYSKPAIGIRCIDYLSGLALSLLSRFRPVDRQYRWRGLLIRDENSDGVEPADKESQAPDTLILPKGILKYPPPEVLLREKTSWPAAEAVYCGAITYNKGVLDLVEAWRQSGVDSTLLIIGAGAPELEETLCRALRGLSNVRYAGAVGYFEKFEIFRRAKMLVLPSRKDHFPSVLFEAMSVGLPVIATRQIRSPVRDGENGLLVDAGNVAMLAKAIRFMLTHPEERRKMADGAKRSVEKYSWDEAVAKLFSLKGMTPLRAEYPSNLSFSISALCQGRCIYCPPERGKRIFPKLMSYELFRRILEMARKDGFRGSFVFGENGEPLLHPQFQPMLESLRSVFPDNRVVLFTNMERMDGILARAVLDGRVDEIHFNFDGATPETYEYVKGLDFEKVSGNIRNFLETRNRGGFPTAVTLQVISGRRYRDAIGDKRMPKFKDDTKQSIRLWKPYLRPGDNISLTPVIRWALDADRRRPKQTPCSMFSRIRQTLYIAPSGKVYLCCLDCNADLVYGDLAAQTIGEIWKSPRRDEMRYLLGRREFNTIGHPCATCAD